MYGSSSITYSGVFSHNFGARILWAVFSLSNFLLLSVLYRSVFPRWGSVYFAGRDGEDGRFTGYWMMGDCLIIFGATGLLMS